MRVSLVMALFFCASSVHAAIPTPDRPITDPQSVTSPTNSEATPVPIEDIAFSRRVSDAAWSADGKQVFLSTNLTGRANIWRVDATGSWPVQITRSEEAQSEVVALPDGKTLLFTQDTGGDELYDIYSVSTEGGPAVNLTATPDIAEDGIVASPDGRQIAFSYKPKVHAQRDLAIMDLGTRAVRVLTHESDVQRRWTIVAWTRDGRNVIANRQNADSTESAVWEVGVADGRAWELIPQHKGGRNIGSGITPDGKTLTVSSNSGSSHLRAGIYDIEGKRYRWLTATAWEQLAGPLAPDGQSFLAQTNENGRVALSIVELGSAVEHRLSLPPGVNSPSSSNAFAGDSKRFLFSHTGADAPADLRIGDAATGSSATLAQLAVASLATSKLPKSQIVTYRSFDGTLISAVLTVPFNLARDGSNPAVVIPHGGPTGASADNFNGTAALLASRGYLVIAPNFRGSTGYGVAFQTANRKDLGGGDLKDVVAGKDFLVATGYVNPKKVGITGGSYGGFMTLMALGKTPDVFAAGVQQYGIIDWLKLYEHTDPLLREYLTSLIGNPAKDKAVYTASSPLTYVNQITAPLLSLQGKKDPRVPPDQALQVRDALKAKGTIGETVFYEDEGHGFRKREHVIDAQQRTIDWFDKYLKGETAATH
jgi:dipeptidyl aminopeptidase/acylaminoacyl peptidase